MSKQDYISGKHRYIFPPTQLEKNKTVYKNTARKPKNPTSAIFTSPLWPRADPPVESGAVTLRRGEVSVLIAIVEL